MRIIALWAILLTSTVPAFAGRFEISLLTCSPGAELYSTYGHSALLVDDRLTGQKTVYNYGTFDFHTPHFALKFIRGNLLYMLNPERYRDFLYEYQSQGRQVIRQRLLITDDEAAHIVRFLHDNLRPENRYYRYDFFFDNCSTRIRDLLEKVLPLTYPRENGDQRFRQLLRPYLTDTPWYLFGTDLILGLPADAPAGFRDEMFLPDYLSKNLAQARLNGQPLLAPAETILPLKIRQSPARVPWPLWVMGLVALSSIAMFKTPARIRTVFDGLLFGAAVLAGGLFLFMWIGTAHTACHRNLNLLWANPLFAFLPIFAGGSRRQMWRLTAIYLTLLLVAWFVLPQHLPRAAWLFTLALAIRAWHHARIARAA